MTPMILGACAAFAAPPSPAAPGAMLPTTYDPSRSLAPLVRAVEPAVVKVEVESPGAAPGSPHSWSPRSGEGSGFVISADGLVLTNHHVVEGANRIVLEWSNGVTRPARLVGGDAAMDVALLRVESDASLAFVTLGDSDALEVGDWVVAMGNGLGLGTTVTAGIVSGKRRVLGADIYGRESFIQTDAAINQGNSGGPLFDLDGNVVGMSTAIIAGANTVGFAIPSNLIASILADLQSKGRVARGFLGVAPQTLNAEMRDALGVKSQAGAMVTSVFADTPASRSGLKSGDVVVSVDGKAVRGGTELIAAIGNHLPGEEVVLEVERDRQLRKVSVTLSERPSDNKEAAIPPEPAPPLTTRGLVLAPAPRELITASGVQGGVLVERVLPGTAAAGRLQAGDLIVLVDRHPVASLADVERHLARSSGEALLMVIRKDEQQFVTLPAP